MSLTTKDIYEKTFKRSKKGFDEDEVDKFLDQVIDEFKAKDNEINALKKEIKAAKDLELKIKGTEDTIMNTLVSAQKSSERILREAGRKAELLIDNAENTAKQKIDSTKHELIVLERKLAAIKQSAYNYAMSFTEMVNIQATSFEKTYQSYFGDMDAYSSGGISFDALERLDQNVSKNIEEIVGTDAVKPKEDTDSLEVEWKFPQSDDIERVEDKPEEQDLVAELTLPEEMPEVFATPEETPEEFVAPEEPAGWEEKPDPELMFEKADVQPSEFEKMAVEPGEFEKVAVEQSELEKVQDEPIEQRKPVDGMPLNEINKALIDIEEGGDERADADKSEFDDYSWLYAKDEKKDKSDFELSFRDPKEGQELKSLIDDLID